MLRKISLSLIAGLLLSSAYAQDSTVVEEKTGPTISGSVDAYYRFNFSNLKSDATFPLYVPTLKKPYRAQKNFESW